MMAVQTDFMVAVNQIAAERGIDSNIVIGSIKEAIKTGFRKGGGFIGDHDTDTRAPIVEHISAKSEDLDSLVEGLIDVVNPKRTLRKWNLLSQIHKETNTHYLNEVFAYCKKPQYTLSPLFSSLYSF